MHYSPSTTKPNPKESPKASKEKMPFSTPRVPDPHLGRGLSLIQSIGSGNNRTQRERERERERLHLFQPVWLVR